MFSFRISSSARFAIFDVGSRVVPSCYAPLFIFKRVSAAPETNDMSHRVSESEVQTHTTYRRAIPSLVRPDTLDDHLDE